MRYMRHHSAELHFSEIERRGFRVMVVRVTGLLTQQSFNYFAPYMAEVVHDASAVVVRLDTAVNIAIEPPSVQTQMHMGESPPPKAVVCPDGQIFAWVRHAYEMAGLGIRRAIFSSEQASLAELWAFLEAGQSRIHSLDGPSTEPAPLES